MQSGTLLLIKLNKLQFNLLNKFYLNYYEFLNSLQDNIMIYMNFTRSSFFAMERLWAFKFILFYYYYYF